MTAALERIFRLRANGTDVKTEVIGGITTFMTMAYIIFVNPAMIAQAGIDMGAALAATCVAAGVSTILMGLYARYPIALAPGMGENAFFTFTVCVTMGVAWQTALGCVFIEGLLFIALTVTRVRQLIVDAIPPSLRYATACGIGIFIAFIGLIDAGIVVKHPATLVALGDIVSAPSALALAGLAITGTLLARKVKGAILWGILIAAALGVASGVVQFQGLISAPPSMTPTFLKMDIMGALDMGLFAVIFVFLFMDIFDTVGTLAGVAELGGFMRKGKLPRAGRALISDAIGTCVGAACGTPTVTGYIESASGISAGARTGLANVVTGLCFFAALFFSPLVRMIGGGCQINGAILHPVTAPALVIVGSMMLKPILNIDWDDPTEAIPAFLTVIAIPLTFSIATGIALGFVSYASLKLLSGRGKKVHWIVYLLAALFILRFLYLKAL